MTKNITISALFNDMQSVCRNKKGCGSCDYGVKYVNGQKVHLKYCIMHELKSRFNSIQTQVG